MSLADLLVSVAVLGLVVGAAAAVLDRGQQAYAIGAARVDAQQSARAALDRIAHDLRAAGRGARGAAFAAMSVAERQRVVLHVDANGDGVIAGPGETITWRLAAGALRRDAGGGAQPVADDVRDLRFTYYDARGAPTAIAAEVRAVGVLVTTAGTQNAAGATFATQVRLRNR